MITLEQNPSLEEGKLKRIHINQHNIRHNNKEENLEELKPVITIKSGSTNTYAHEIEINGPTRVVYSPHKPLGCGARVWIETKSEVTLIR